MSKSTRQILEQAKALYLSRNAGVKVNGIATDACVLRAL